MTETEIQIKMLEQIIEKALATNDDLSFIDKDGLLNDYELYKKVFC